MRRGWCGAVMVLAAACDQYQALEPVPGPEVVSAIAMANPNNLISAIVITQVRFADSVAVRYGLEGARASLDQVTPAIVPTVEVVPIPEIGGAHV